jgi:hypothetical protein
VQSCFVVKHVDQCYVGSREPPVKGWVARLTEGLFVISWLGVHIFHFGYDNDLEIQGKTLGRVTSDLRIVLGGGAAG